MDIWHKSLNLDEINKFNINTLVSFLNIEITNFSSDELHGTMPVSSKTHQPFGLLHGGASCVLAETLGSIASNLCVDLSKFYCVGLDINANHLRSVKDGVVTAIAKKIHLGRSTHVWDVKIYDEQMRMICVSRLTMAVIKK